MSTHRLTASQLIPRPIDEVAPFFEDPRNLGRLTPSSIIVVMPLRTAASSISPEPVCEPIRPRTFSVISSHSNTPERPR